MTMECRFRDADGACVHDYSNCNYRTEEQCFMYVPQRLTNAVSGGVTAVRQLADVREKVKALEWVNEECPVCKAPHAGGNGHAPGCWLDNFIQS